jgi:hypothetical protein
MRWELEEKGGQLLNYSLLGMINDNAEELWIGGTFKWRQRGANAFHKHRGGGKFFFIFRFTWICDTCGISLNFIFYVI